MIIRGEFHMIADRHGSGKCSELQRPLGKGWQNLKLCLKEWRASGRLPVWLSRHRMLV